MVNHFKNISYHLLSIWKVHSGGLAKHLHGCGQQILMAFRTADFKSSFSIGSGPTRKTTLFSSMNLYIWVIYNAKAQWPTMRLAR